MLNPGLLKDDLTKPYPVGVFFPLPRHLAGVFSPIPPQNRIPEIAVLHKKRPLRAKMQELSQKDFNCTFSMLGMGKKLILYHFSSQKFRIIFMGMYFVLLKYVS
jgi:hypothetical protein